LQSITADVFWKQKKTNTERKPNKSSLHHRHQEDSKSMNLGLKEVYAIFFLEEEKFGVSAARDGTSREA
jgi:hypothetical protein